MSTVDQARMATEPSRIDVAANVAALIVIAAVAYHVMADVPKQALRDQSDFRSFWLSGQDSFYGSPGYPNRNNPHTTVLLFGPFWSFSLTRAWLLYSVVNIGCMLAATAFMVRAVRVSWWAVLPAFALLSMWPHGWSSMSKGQVTGPLMLGLAITWWGVERDRDGVASAALGVALAMKVFVALPVVCLWLSGKRQVAIGATVIAAGVYLIGTVVAPDLYAMHARMLQRVSVTNDGNHSLLGASAVLWSPIALLVPAVAICVPVATWRARADVALAISVVGMLLLSPLGWYYYLPSVLIVLLVCWNYGRPWLGAVFWLTTGVDVYGLPTLGLLALLAVLVVLRFQSPDIPRGPVGRRLASPSVPSPTRP